MALHLHTATTLPPQIPAAAPATAAARPAPQTAAPRLAKDNGVAAKNRMAAQGAAANAGGKVGGVPLGPWTHPKVLTKPLSFDMATVDFSRSAPAISSAQKFIIPVPNFEGEKLVYPKGHEKAGKEITDWQGTPIGGRGVVFHNAKDDAVQAVKADGNGVIILNQVSEAQGQALLERIGPNPEKLSLAQLKEVLSFAQTELGLTDMYNSDRGFITKNMQALEKSDTKIAAFGMHRRDARDRCEVTFVEGRGEFRGTATAHQFDDGAVILKQGSDVRLVQPEIFAQTYTQPDGSPIDLASLPRQVAPAIRRDYGGRDAQTALRDLKDPARMKAYVAMIASDAGEHASSALEMLRDQATFTRMPAAQLSAWRSAIAAAM